MDASSAERHPRTVDTEGPGATIPPRLDLSAPEDIAMPTPIRRRTFLEQAGTTAALTLFGAPLIAPSRAGAAGDRLVVAGGGGGIETALPRGPRPAGEKPGGRLDAPPKQPGPQEV